MSRDLYSVECIGTFSLVDLWRVETPIGMPFVSLGHWGGSVMGNDAMIVSRELERRGLPARCRLLDPTNDDMAVVRSVLSGDAVLAVGQRTGESTRSLCLEDTLGRRSWIFSRVPEPRDELGEVDANVIYVDYYPELVEYLNHNLARVAEMDSQVVVNLSAVAAIDDVPRLIVKPSVMQASITRNASADEAAIFAVQLGERTGAQRAFVTLGARGAVLAMGRKTWYSEPSKISGDCILGSGALFSSEVILGLLDGLDGSQLLESSVVKTALHLKSSTIQ